MNEMRFGLATTLLSFVTLTLGLAHADLQIVTLNVVSTPALSDTNRVVRKVTPENYREDQSPMLSIFVLRSKGEQVALNHHDKTYQRVPIGNEEGSPEDALPLVASGERKVIANQEAEVYRWTNAAAQGCLWVGRADPFLAATNSPAPGTTAIVTPNLVVGSLLASNRIVLGSEYRTTLSVPVEFSDGLSGTALSRTNFVVTLTSTLMSVTLTNFDRSEFKVPADYRDVTGQPPKPSLLSPSALGPGMAGRDNLNLLRQDLQAGRPLLSVPRISPTADGR